jgi:hypothetical protein
MSRTPASEDLDPEDRDDDTWDHDDDRNDLDDDLDEDPEDDGRERRVVRRPNPLPSREEDEEELAEADILEEIDLDLDEIDNRGPDA